MAETCRSCGINDAREGGLCPKCAAVAAELAAAAGEPAAEAITSAAPRRKRESTVDPTHETRVIRRAPKNDADEAGDDDEVAEAVAAGSVPESLPGGSPDPAEPPPPPEAGRRFGSYMIIKEISRGSMGVVYRAEQTSLRREVALKVLLAGEHASAKQVSRFRREAQAIARLHHPNIVPVFEVGEEGGRHYFAMAYVRGRTLAEVVKQEGAMEPARALEICEAVADAVHAAHTRGVIHRDIKPSNIMLDERGGAHIMDFGLAKQVDAETQHTQSGTTLGTPAYMPPEQARGEVSAIDARSDVYSIGAVLYELVTGRAPFTGLAMLDIVLAVINNDPPAPRAVNPRVHRDIETIILRAMDKEAARRYASAAELRDDIRRYRAGEAILARPSSALARAWRRLVRRRHTLGWIAAAVLLVVAAVALLAVAEAERRRREDAAHDAEMMTGEWQTRLVESFAPASLEAHWSRTASVYPDAEGPRVRDVTAPRLVGVDVWSGNVRLIGTLAVPEGAAEGRFHLALKGNEEPPHVAYAVRWGGGRLSLVGRRTLERALSSPVVLAEKNVPLLAPGRKYEVVFERRDVTLSVRVTGPEIDEELRYRNPHLSHWRLKLLRAEVRDTTSGAPFERLELQTQEAPERAGKLQIADRLFFIGEYHQARENYESILRRSAPAGDARAHYLEQLLAHHRLGLYHDLKNDPARAREAYREVIRLQPQALGDRVPPPEVDAVLREVYMRGLVCAFRLRDFKGAESALARYAEGPYRIGAPWIWDLVFEARRSLVAEGAPAGAAHALVAASDCPPGFWAMEDLVLRTALAYVESCEHGKLDELYAAYPTSLLAAAYARAVERAALGSRFAEGLDLLALSARRFPGDARLVRAGGRLASAALEAKEYLTVIPILRAAPDLPGEGLLADAVWRAVSDERGRLDEALQIFAFARDRLPRLSPALQAHSVVLAGKLRERGEAGGVSRVYRAYPNPALAQAYKDAAEALVARGRYTPALALLAEARAHFGGRDAKFASLAAAAGRAYATLGLSTDVKRAYEAYPSASFAPAFRTLGARLLERGEHAAAAGLYVHVRARCPAAAGDAAHHAARALAAARTGGSFAAAFRPLALEAERLAEERPFEAAWQLAVADVLVGAGLSTEALDWYALAGADGAPDAVAAAAALHRAELLIMDGRAAEGLAAFDALAAAWPGSAEAAGARAVQERSGEALERLRAARPRPFGEAHFALLAGLNLRLAGQTEEAEEALGHARKKAKPGRWPAPLVGMGE